MERRSDSFLCENYFLLEKHNKNMLLNKLVHHTTQSADDCHDQIMYQFLD